MSGWAPSTDFEEEVVSSQPLHNFIFAQLAEETNTCNYIPRPQKQLEDFKRNRRQRQIHEQNILTDSQTMPSKYQGRSLQLDMIAKVQEIAGTKGFGEFPTLNDWDDRENIEMETVAMMRKIGLGPSIDTPLNEELTLSTFPIPEEQTVSVNGSRRIPILFDSKYFELKSRRNKRIINPEIGWIGENVNQQNIKFDDGTTLVTPITNESMEIKKINSCSSISNILCNLEDHETEPSFDTKCLSPTDTFYSVGSNNSRFQSTNSNDSSHDLNNSLYQLSLNMFPSIEESNPFKTKRNTTNNPNRKTGQSVCAAFHKTPKINKDSDNRKNNNTRSQRGKRPNQKERFITARQLYEKKLLHH